MCGIVAYLGPRTAQNLLLEGLKRLEYRGYDSAGVAVISDSDLRVTRAKGRISVLEDRLEADGHHAGSIGIGHTRWATHGEPNEANAHPHTDATGRIAVVHNGIIENYVALRSYLAKKNIDCSSETDTEVLAKLIGHLYATSHRDLERAVQAALREVTGAYAIAVICADDPNTLVIARKGSPMIIGLGPDSFIAASDASAIVSHTTQVISLDDYQVARLSIGADGVDVRTSTIDNIPVNVIESPDFEYGKSEVGKDESGAVQVPYYVMNDDAKRFVQALPRNGFILKFNWGEWQDEARRYVENSEMLNGADLETVCKLFTTHVRKDRFCEGHLKAMIDNGHIGCLLGRLDAI